MLTELSLPCGGLVPRIVALLVLGCPDRTLGKGVPTAIRHTACRIAVNPSSIHSPPQVSTLALGSQDEDFPFPCSPGVYGNGNEIETQLSHVCAGACPAGSICPSATHTPQRTSPQKAQTAIPADPAILTRESQPCVAQLARPVATARKVQPRGRSAHRARSRTVRVSYLLRSAIPVQPVTSASVASQAAALSRHTTRWSASSCERHANRARRTL